MLRRLAAGEQSIGELAAPFRMSIEGASKHVRTLESAGLIPARLKGGRMSTPWSQAPLAAGRRVHALYERFWAERLDLAEQALKREDETGHDRYNAYFRPPHEAFRCP